MRKIDLLHLTMLIIAIFCGYLALETLLSLLNSQPARNYLILELLRVTLGCFLIYAAPSLANMIEKNIAVRLDGRSQSG
jgi:hypothetical protein